MKNPKTSAPEVDRLSEDFPSDLDSDPGLAGVNAAGEGEKGSKRGKGAVAARRFPLPAGTRPRPARLTQFEAELMSSVKAMIDDIEVLDELIEKMHLLLEQLMYGTRRAVGVAWTEHPTRGGLHPVAYRQGDTKRALVTLRMGRPVTRFWVTELNPPIRLATFALGDPKSDEWLVRAQKDVLRALERLLGMRARAMACAGGQRKAVAIWARQVRPGLTGRPVEAEVEEQAVAIWIKALKKALETAVETKPVVKRFEPVEAAFETKTLWKRIAVEHFRKAHERGVALVDNRQAGADAAREQDEADIAQRPQ